MAGGPGFTYRGGISIAQIVAFSPLFLFAVYFKYTGPIGWFCCGVFCLLRLIGASCKLAAMNSDSRGLSAAIFVCKSLGMILIIFLLLGILERAYVITLYLLSTALTLFGMLKQSTSHSSKMSFPPPVNHNLDLHWAVEISSVMT
jgi:hypothetical protein